MGTLFSRYKARSVTTDLWVTTVTERDQKQLVTHEGPTLLEVAAHLDPGKVSRKQKGTKHECGHLGWMETF